MAMVRIFIHAHGSVLQLNFVDIIYFGLVFRSTLTICFFIGVNLVLLLTSLLLFYVINGEGKKYLKS